MKNPFSDIPLAEASGFFLSLRQFPKVANMAPPQILPATAMGQNKVPMTAPSLTPTARGENAIKVARIKRAAEEMATLPSPGAQGATPLDPSAYLAVEQAGQNAQNENAVEFYKQKLEAAKAELAQLQEGQQSAQQQIQQLSEQMQQSQQAAEGERQNFQSMTAQATQQAAMAQDQALMAQRASAAMRMAYQQLRGSLLELAQNDPPAGTGGDPSTAAPPPMMGDPGMGGAGAPPGAAPAAAAAAPQEAAAPAGAPAGTAPLAAKTASRPPSREELDAEWERVMRMERDSARAEPHTLMSPSAAMALALGAYGGGLGGTLGRGPTLIGAGAGAALGATVGALQKDQEPIPVNHRDTGMYAGGLLGSLAGAHAHDPHRGPVGLVGGGIAGRLAGLGAEWLAKRKGQPSEKNAGLRDVADALAGQARQIGGVLKDRAPMAAAGALLGGGASLASQQMGSRSDNLRQKLTQQQNGDGGFANALRTAATKARLAVSEVEDAHPIASAGMGALLGAGAGLSAGPQMRASVDSIKNNLGQIRHLGKK